MGNMALFGNENLEEGSGASWLEDLECQVLNEADSW